MFDFFFIKPQKKHLIFLSTLFILCAVVISLSKSKIEIKRKKKKWIQIQSKYHQNHNLSKVFKHILSKFDLFFFHQRLKKEETEAVTKEPTKEQSDTAKDQNDEENEGAEEQASGSSWWGMDYSSILNKAVSSVSIATTAAALNAAELAKQKVRIIN